MNPTQAYRRHKEPPARGRVAARYVRPVGVDLREFDLSARQALLGRGQQPFHGLRSTALNDIAVIVQAIVVEDAEIALGENIAGFGCFEQPFLHPITLCTRFRERRG